MKKHLLLVGLLLASIFQLVKIEGTIQLYFFAVIIVLTGVPHGSLDYFVEEQTLKHINQKISLATFLTNYLVNMVIYGLCWFFFPTLALIAFIGLTAYHFGEIDWPIRKNTILDSILYSVYGLQLIVFIITSHIQEAAPILELIVRGGISASTWLAWGDFIFKICMFSLSANLLLLIIYKKQIEWSNKVLLQFLIQTVILICIIYKLPLYLSFGFYFGFWHSLLSFNLIRKQMNLPDNTIGWVRLIKKAIPFTVIAWMGLLFLVSLAVKTNNQVLLLSNLLIGIAILTLPHLQVFTKIKENEFIRNER